MMRMRWLLTAVEDLSTSTLRGHARKLKNERRSATGTVTLGVQRSAELLGRERATVQTEAVTRLAGRETVREKGLPILCGDPHAIVDDGDAHTIDRALDTQREQFIGSTRFVAGVLAIAHQVHQYL